MIRRVLSLTGLLLLVISNPAIAARERISLAPAAGEYSEADIEKEVIFGREMAAIILTERKISPDQRLNRYVNLVGQSILRHTNRPELSYYFAAIESESINAYAAPGGYIFVTTAALDRMRNEAELAGVLAHEIAHVTDRHIVTALDIRDDDESMVAAISRAVTVSTESTSVVFAHAIRHALDLLFTRGLGAEDEHAADVQALFLSAASGYDATAYYGYLERIGPEVEAATGELDRTHPSFAERLARLGQIIDQEGLSAMGGYKNEKRFRANVRGED